MNRIFRISLAFLLLTPLVACQKNAATGSPAETTASAPKPVPAEMTEYAVSIADIPQGGNCSLDAINGASKADAVVTSGEDTIFGGWMADGNGAVPADARLVFSSEAGSYSLPVTGGVERPDVAKALGREGLAKSGYNVATSMPLAPGMYDLFIVVHGGEAAAACSLNVRLTVK